VALAGAGLADDQRVGAFADELQGVQLEAGCARQLGVEAPVEVGQRGRSSRPDCLKRRSVRRERRRSSSSCSMAAKRIQEGLLGGLGLHHAGLQGLSHARQAQLRAGAFDLVMFMVMRRNLLEV
jgi:hypothetical protein